MVSVLWSEDRLDYFTFEHGKHMFSGRSGKQRSKLEVSLHTNRFDPNGHTRKISTKFRNAERRSQNKKRIKL